MVTADYIRAHRHSIHHRDEILKSKSCGCFDCLSIFQPSDIKEWTDSQETALCPKCGIDSVIGDESGYPITKEFLLLMQKHWLDTSGIDLSAQSL